MRETPKRILAFVAVAVTIVFSGCASAEMTASTACSEFLQKPLDEQNAAIARISNELGTRNAMTPLGRPNIDYQCSRNQDLTLGEAIRRTG